MSKGVLLLSGGLDSSLSGLLLKRMGVDLVALHLESPFGCDSMAETMAREIGVPLVVRPKGDAFLEMLAHPRYGYGSAMNPCVDCRIHMFRLGRAFMDEVGASFLVTGEVLGQRPMSQKKRAIVSIDADSGMEGLVLRPLSARLLPETLPEKDGTVDRKKLFGWAGRSRKPQLELARRLGLSVVPSPAGGCLLTDSHFNDRIEDFVKIDWSSGEEGEASRSAVAGILRYGRHFRFEEGEWVVVGRSLEDNQNLERHIRGAGVAFRPQGFDGPLVCLLSDPPVPVSRMEALAAGALHAFGGEKVPDGPLPVTLLTSEGERSHTLPRLSPDLHHLRDKTVWMARWRK